MENLKLVMPEHLNHYGNLFGGYLLMWVDEVAYIASRFDYPDCNLVTIGMGQVEFHHGVKQGDILRFTVEKSRVGNTSVSYKVDVHALQSGVDRLVFDTTVTFVNVENGEKKPLPVSA